jgi:diguanylate cyclase (GGDEF)-like protein/PAS domain S-box-containing protein
MHVLENCRRFLVSKSGLGLFLYVTLCAALCAAVGYGFYYSSLDWFKAHKSEEKITALELVDAFVGNYSAIRAKLGPDAPVPATFRARSIEIFNMARDVDFDFRLRWVGRQGREIKTPPTDAHMAQVIEAFAAKPGAKPESEFVTADGQLKFRTVYPSLAQPSCVECHNKLQPGQHWQVNDVMGAFAIDVPAEGFLRTIWLQSIGLGLGLFFGLAAIGLVIAILHFRHMREREAAALEVGRARSFLDTIVENMPLMVTVKEASERRYVLVNKAAESLLGVSHDEALGQRLEDVLPKRLSAPLLAGDSEALISRGLTVIAEQAIEAPLGGTLILSTKKLPILGENGEPQYLLALSEDITERKAVQERIAYIAHHDALTDLPNRAAFTQNLASIFERGRASRSGFAILCMDLDRFKEVNDLFGHGGGDALLGQVAQRLRAACDGGFVARLGGDEFAAILTGGELPAASEALAQRFMAAIGEDFEVEGHQLRVGLSIGIAIYPADGSDLAELLSNADAALYRAKAEGRGTIRFFEIDMDQRLREKRALQHELRSALQRGELSLHYQPQARMDGKIIGFEALVRWRRGARGMIPPDTFIPLAEESGLIISMGEWILREACREAASWPLPLQIAVNLSPIQFRHGDLAALVHAVLLETGLAPQRLELEITEGVLLEDTSRALSILRRLKALGVRIAMDDFGTGYSSLSYLQSFPFDKIKIDRAFISNLEKNAQSAAIVSAVIGLARGLDMPVLAEGVETEYQRAFLTRESCNEIQGYLIGRPCPISEFADLLGRQSAAPEREHAAQA